MDKGILRLAEQLYIAEVSVFKHDENITEYCDGSLQDYARESINAAEVFYQVKGERELEVGK